MTDEDCLDLAAHMIAKEKKLSIKWPNKAISQVRWLLKNHHGRGANTLRKMMFKACGQRLSERCLRRFKQRVK